MGGGKLLIIEQIPLVRQIDTVFKELVDELSYLSSGMIFVQIRNNMVGKFGVRHDPIQGQDVLMKGYRSGLSEQQQHAFRQMALESLQFKKGWTHGEILFDFAIRSNKLITSVQFESNYNMANLFGNLDEKRRVSRA
jgi:hypothetical protein